MRLPGLAHWITVFFFRLAYEYKSGQQFLHGHSGSSVSGETATEAAAVQQPDQSDIRTAFRYVVANAQANSCRGKHTVTFVAFL